MKKKQKNPFFQLEELSEAEDALSEANILNNKDPEVWGYLSLLCLKTGRKIEAEQAYKYAIKVRRKEKLKRDRKLPFRRTVDRHRTNASGRE